MGSIGKLTLYKLCHCERLKGTWQPRAELCVRYANVATWLFYLLGVVGLVPEPDGTSGSGTTPSTSWGSQNLRFGATKQPAKIYKDFTIYLHNCDIVMVKYYQNLDDGSSGRTESERANSE